MNSQCSEDNQNIRKQPYSVEFEIPYLILKQVVTDLPYCQLTLLDKTELPYITKITKTKDYVKFIFEGNDVEGPLVEIVSDNWRCKISPHKCLHESDSNQNEIQQNMTEHAAQINSDFNFHIKGQMHVLEMEHIMRVDWSKNEEDKEATGEIKACHRRLSTQKSPKQNKMRTKRLRKNIKKTDTDNEFNKCDVEVEQPDPNVNKETIKKEEALNGENKDKLNSDQLNSNSAQSKHQAGKIQQTNRRFGCPGCSKFFNSLSKLSYHVTHSHKNRPDLNELEKKLEDLVYTLSSRSKSLIIQNCSVCGRERRGITLLNHLTVWHSDNKNYKQLMEEAKAQYHKNKLATKLEREKLLFCQQTCQFCGKEFSYRASYRKHVTYTCKLNPNRQQLFYCNTCGYSSPSAEACSRHRQQHSMETKFICDLCGKEYSNRSGLVIHQRDVHQLVKKMPIHYHVCHVCQQKFYFKTHYDKHMTKHNDYRSAQCDLCGKQFKHLDHLNRHRREVHLNQYRYCCDKCGHGMAKLSYLEAHKCGRTKRAQNKNLDPGIINRSDTYGNTDSNESMKQTTQVFPDGKQNENVVHLYDEIVISTQETTSDGVVLAMLNPAALFSVNQQNNLFDGTQLLDAVQQH